MPPFGFPQRFITGRTQVLPAGVREGFGGRGPEGSMAARSFLKVWELNPATHLHYRKRQYIISIV